MHNQDTKKSIIGTGVRHLRPTWAEIDLDALTHNFRTLRSLLVTPQAEIRNSQFSIGKAAIPRLIPVIKSDAYGHGAVACAKALSAAGANAFAVALVEEGEALRLAGVSEEIVVLEGAWPGQECDLVRHGLTAIAFSPEGIQRLDEAGRRQGKQVDAHIKIDTGMARLGVAWDRLGPLLSAMRDARFVRLSGTCTHLACAEEEDPSYTREQIRRFERALLEILEAGLDPGEIHIANSAGLLYHGSLRSHSARPGIALYGYPPTPERCAGEFHPVMTVKTRVGCLRQLGAGESVGYNRRFTASGPIRTATLPIGYSDGYTRGLAGKAGVIIRGAWAPLLGAVSMDMIVVDVTGIPDLFEGEEVILMGAEAGLRFDAADWARTLDTIPYEVLCGIGARIPRVYLNSTGTSDTPIP